MFEIFCIKFNTTLITLQGNVLHLVVKIFGFSEILCTLSLNNFHIRRRLFFNAFPWILFVFTETLCNVSSYFERGEKFFALSKMFLQLTFRATVQISLLHFGKSIIIESNSHINICKDDSWFQTD